MWLLNVCFKIYTPYTWGMDLSKGRGCFQERKLQLPILSIVYNASQNFIRGTHLCNLFPSCQVFFYKKNTAPWRKSDFSVAISAKTELPLLSPVTLKDPSKAPLELLSSNRSPIKSRMSWTWWGALQKARQFLDFFQLGKTKKIPKTNELDIHHMNHMTHAQNWIRIIFVWLHSAFLVEETPRKDQEGVLKWRCS